MISKQQTLSDWLCLVQAEYREIPGLQLTKPQARRLWGLDEPTCDRILEDLVASSFLRKTDHDMYALARY